VRQPEQEINSALNLYDAATGNSQWTAAFSYDVLGNVVTATDANGVTVANTYDRAGRVKTRSYSGEPAGQTTPIVNFYYDGKGLASQQSPNYAKGKLTKVDNGVSATVHPQFDNFGRVTQSSQITDGQTYTSGYLYNLSGALLQETYPSGRVVKNEFESDGDITRIYGRAAPNATERTYANSFKYMPDGKIEQLKLGNGLWERAAFNSRLQVTELNLGLGVNGDLWKLGYEYGEMNADGSVDAAKNTGNIAKQTVSFNGLAQPFIQKYNYDALSRLTEASETSGAGANAPQTWKESFGYDRYGNRTAHDKFYGTTQAPESNISDPTIDSGSNKFTSGQGYTFDQNGNLVVDAENRTFTFNADNKQTKVTQNGHLVGEYSFDGEGKRVKKRVYTNDVLSEETVFVYSNGKLVAEYSTAPQPENPTTNYAATDQLGSPRVLTDTVGRVVSRRDFMPFGEEVAADTNYRVADLKYGVSDSVRQKFTGYQKDDETQLDFAEARMYENRHGRFTAIDPLLASGKSANPQTFNRYAYALSNPLILNDPTGMQVGKWYTPVTPDGEPDSTRRPQYIRNGDSTEGFREVTEKNKLGQLIARGAGLADSRVVRFNPMGPRQYNDWSAIFRDIIFGPIGGTSYVQNGWDVVLTDEARADYMRTGTVENALEAYDVALFASPFKFSVAGRAAAESANLTGTNAFRYVTQGEVKAIEETRMLRGGQPGETFFTKDLYKSTEKATERLSLKTPATHRLEFQFQNNPLLQRNGTRVLPDFLRRGGGNEFMTLDKVKVKIINVQPLRPETK
jgi:RHS repeat-associated protein